MLTLHRLWRAHGMLTAARGKALSAHLAACRARAKRPGPGSHAWPDLRTEAERRFAAGLGPHAVAHDLPSWRRPDSVWPLPSRRTIRRWHAQRRWLQEGPGPPFDTIQRR